jgi:hypothetical protein
MPHFFSLARIIKASIYHSIWVDTTKNTAKEFRTTLRQLYIIAEDGCHTERDLRSHILMRLICVSD